MKITAIKVINKPVFAHTKFSNSDIDNFDWIDHLLVNGFKLEYNDDILSIVKSENNILSNNIKQGLDNLIVKWIELLITPYCRKTLNKHLPNDAYCAWFNVCLEDNKLCLIKAYPKQLSNESVIFQIVTIIKEDGQVYIY